jgi:tetratricopeptide (TPR) repeat protein
LSRCFVTLLVVMLGACAARAQSTSGAATSPPSAGSNDASSAQAHAMELLEHGKSAEAIASLEAMANAHPDQKGVQHDLGLAYYRTGKLVEARKAFERAIAADPKDLESVQLEGLTLYRLGQPAAAIPYLQRVREFSSNANADANHVLGLCYLNSRKFDEARQAFAAEYALQPESGAAHLVLAKMMMAANLPDQGADEAAKALTVSPTLALAHFVLGEGALYKSDVDRAIKEFQAERAVNPGYAPVYERLGDAYLRSNKIDAAQEALMQSLALDTTSTGPFILMGKVLLRKNDPENAALYLKHAEKMDPSSYIAHTLLGQAYRSLGKEAQAKEEFATAESIHAASQLKLQPVQ